ncbi:MAG: inositol monophosphatase family protein [Gaiellaceae bacterium]|jgi:histidinol-phosphatase
MSSDLEFAASLADLADGLALARFGALDLRVETKPDLSPVTETDRAIEQALRKRIAEERRGDVVLGEEEGSSGEGGRRWILDPIDGTRNYSRDIPVFATLIALEVEGEVELGLVSAPALGRRWWAERGKGAFRDDGQIKVSGVKKIEDATLSIGFGHRMAVSAVSRLEDAVVSFELGEGIERLALLAARAWHARSFGDFWQHVLVAEGAVDVAIDPVVKIWDCAPLKLIVEEAGGKFTDMSGRAVIDGGSGVSTNGLLHAEALSALGVD